MRVTSQSLSAQVIEGMQQAYQRVARAQEAVTSGRRINHLSDDPIGATRVSGLRSFEATLVQYQRNIDNSMPFLDQTDAALGHVTDGLQRAKEIALAMANDTYGPKDRQIAAAEVHQIFLQTLSQANARVENRFLFGGFINGSAPFVEGASRVNYFGDNGQIAIQTNPASTLNVNLPGNVVFQGTGAGGGTGIFDTLQDLEMVLRGESAANSVNLAVNLEAGLAVGGGFSPTDSVGTEAPQATFLGEADFSAVVTVFDAKGQAHNLTFLFAKTAATTFTYRVVADSDEINGATPGNLYQIAPEGSLVFDAGGTLDTGASTITDITLSGLMSGAPDITIAGTELDFSGSTQQALPSALLSLTQTNTIGIHAQIGRLSAALDQVSSARTEVGARLMSAKTATDAVELMRVRTIAQRSGIEDADALSVYSDFARYQSALQAALQSAARLVQPTLLDFLR